jgi:hypothetical protein
MNHRESEPCRHSGVHGIPARLQDFDSHLGSQLVHRDHHRMLRVNGTGGSRGQRRSSERQSCGEQNQEFVKGSHAWFTGIPEKQKNP